MTNILLIDLSSIAHPLFHVSASDPDPNATSIKTVERVRALASGQPHVAICIDSGKSFRKDLDPAYKANRPTHDAALQHQIKLAIETLKTDGFPVWGVPGYEADDVIGTAVRLATNLVKTVLTDKAVLAHVGHMRAEETERVTVTIATADKDLMQLIGPRVTVHALTSGNVLDADAVKAKYGVAPDQVVDFLSLVGDSSDNIKGAKGIGAKTAASLLQKYGNLEDLYDNLTQHGTQFTPGLATTLREFQPRLALTRDLIRLKTDAPISFADIFKPRVPADIEVFDDDELADTMVTLAQTAMNELAGDDIDEAMPTWEADTLRSGDVVMHPIPDAAVIGRSAAEQAPAAVVTRAAAPGATAQPVPPLSAQNASGPTNGEWTKVNTLPVAKSVPRGAQAPVSIEKTALVPLPTTWERELEPRDLRDCEALAQRMFRSRLFSAYGTYEGVMTTILAGRELGVGAMSSLRGFNVIDGKQQMGADLIRALVIKSGKAKYFRLTERTAERATWETQRGTDPPISLTYTIEEARIAGLVKPNSGWMKNPADMVTKTASAKLCRIVYADVGFNLYDPAEFEANSD